MAKVENVVISEKEFKAKFEKALLNNPTTHTILSKESNIGFMTRLVTDALKTDLVESIFGESDPVAETSSSDDESTGETVSESTEDSTENEPNEEPAESESDANDGLDDLDELD
ncbi:MAG: hypothetical protein PHC95_05050 [Parabacteroides sp.]|nr:hypothetical protein [Parabacteroides sp.]